jgi:peptidoglycan/LPS O-acetylase OafA/YrhL
MLAAFMWPEVVGTHYLYMRTEFRIDAVAYGVALAAACELPELRPILLRLIQPVVFAITLIVALAAIVLGGDWFANVLRYAILGPCMAILIMAILFSSRYETFQWALNLPAMAWTGRLSYSLYVWHIPCFLVSTWAVEGIGGVILSWPLSFIVAALSYYCVELPAIRYGKQFGGQRRAPIGQ